MKTKPWSKDWQHLIKFLSNRMIHLNKAKRKLISKFNT